MYKDLAKWLIGFVPVTTLIALGVALAPSATEIAEVGLKTWLDDQVVTLVAIGVALAAMVALIAMCARVLLAEPSPWSALAGDADWMSTAFSRYAVGRPEFLDSGAFADAALKSRSDAAHPQKDAVKEVTMRIVALSGDLNAKVKLKQFLWVFVVGAVITVVGVLVVLVTASDGPDLIGAPTAVTLHIPPHAVDTFTDVTGCTSPTTVVGVAVGGSVERPELLLFGDGCPAEVWDGASALGVVVTM